LLALARRYTLCGTMFVRWQTRPKTQHRRSEHWAAVLVRNTRINGKPTSHHVAYLGGITKSDAKDAECRVQFWAKASSVLAGLGDQLSTEQRRKIEAALAPRVPKPNKKEMRRHSHTRQQSRLPLGLEDEQFDLDIDREEAEERAL
jgi:hypothetical protein